MFAVDLVPVGSCRSLSLGGFIARCLYQTPRFEGMEYRLSPEELIKREAQKVLMEEIMHLLCLPGTVDHGIFTTSTL